ncbi:MAG: hypothetical protein ACOC96_09095 [Actinomycetota bacterium]
MTTPAGESAPPGQQRKWLPHAGWAAAAVVAFLLGIGIGGGGDDATSTGATEPEPAPTVTVTPEPEVVEVDPSEETLAELEQRAAELDERKAALDEREAELEEQASALDEREEAIAGAEQEVEEGTIPGDGVFLVGDDIEPGTYRGDGSSGTCYWARLSGTSGDLDDIIANDLPQGPTVVTIAESDVAFETVGCADWVRQ